MHASHTDTNTQTHLSCVHSHFVSGRRCDSRSRFVIFMSRSRSRSPAHDHAPAFECPPRHGRSHLITRHGRIEFYIFENCVFDSRSGSIGTAPHRLPPRFAVPSHDATGAALWEGERALRGADVAARAALAAVRAALAAADRAEEDGGPAGEPGAGPAGQEAEAAGPEGLAAPARGGDLKFSAPGGGCAG